MATDAKLSQLRRALRGESPQHAQARRIIGQKTARDMHPTQGSEALMQEAASGSSTIRVVSLNTSTSGGGKGFIWGVRGFGWTDGTL